MPKNPYFWSHEEEKRLMDLWKKGEHDARIIAAQLNRKPEAIRKKLQRLGLVVGHKEKISRTTTTKEEEETQIKLDIPDELPSVEQALKLLVAAMNALSQPGLSKSDIQRLRNVVSTVKTYQGLFADYVHYREIETELVELRKKYEQSGKAMGLKAQAVRRAWSRIGRNATGFRLLASTVGVQASGGPCSIEGSGARGTRALGRSVKLRC
jgi:IS30 family transposase